MPIREDRIPPHTIPSLQEPERFRDFVQNLLFSDSYRSETWDNEGEGGYEEEIAHFFGSDPFVVAVERMVKNNGDLLLTSFGGGRLKGVLDLRTMLLYAAKEFGIKSNIKIVEYALTKQLAHEGVKEYPGAAQLEKEGALEIHIGPLELRDISDSVGSDIMLSRFGPFFHADTVRQSSELVAKASHNLAPNGGVGFFHVKEERIDVLAKCLRKDFGSTEFIVDIRTITPPNRSEQNIVIVTRRGKKK